MCTKKAFHAYTFHVYWVCGLFWCVCFESHTNIGKNGFLFSFSDNKTSAWNKNIIMKFQTFVVVFLVEWKMGHLISPNACQMEWAMWRKRCVWKCKTSIVYLISFPRFEMGSFFLRLNCNIRKLFDNAKTL